MWFLSFCLFFKFELFLRMGDVGGFFGEDGKVATGGSRKFLDVGN